MKQTAWTVAAGGIVPDPQETDGSYLRRAGLADWGIYTAPAGALSPDGVFLEDPSSSHAVIRANPRTRDPEILAVGVSESYRPPSPASLLNLIRERESGPLHAAGTFDNDRGVFVAVEARSPFSWEGLDYPVVFAAVGKLDGTRSTGLITTLLDPDTGAVLYVGLYTDGALLAPRAVGYVSERTTALTGEVLAAVGDAYLSASEATRTRSMNRRFALLDEWDALQDETTRGGYRAFCSWLTYRAPTRGTERDRKRAAAALFDRGPQRRRLELDRSLHA